MKKTLLFLGIIFFASGIFAQCSELFFSEYAEGYSNNKGLEIYNPTSQAINLSEYSIARFSNGATSTGTTRIIQLPDVMLAANDVFVVVVDLTDTTLWDSQFDKPVWNGYNLIDTIFDSVTGDPVLDSLGNVVFGPQYNDDGAALFGDEYNEEYDMQCKADIFLCPDYDTNNTMYFNGNDAMALVKGTEVAQDGSNLVDVIGVIGEDPTVTIMEDAWVDENGYWLTKDRTLVRKPEVGGGRSDLNDVTYALGGTFVGAEWFSYPKNSFQYLGTHNSVCHADTNPDEVSCMSVGTYEINAIPFMMYPNPNSSGMVTIEAAEQIDRIEVYNILGQFVFSENVSFSSDKVELNLANIEKGMYLINLIFDNNQVSIQKLVVE